MDRREEQRLFVAAIVQSVLLGALAPDAALGRFPASTWDDLLLSRAYSALEHFAQDDDIRARDPDYGRAQRDYLRAVLAELEETE
jgi:hypothetical protein